MNRLLSLLALVSMASCTARIEGVRAVLDSDPTVNNAPALQAVIDSVSASGGGRVIIPEGTYMLGTLYLKDGIELYLEDGAELLGSLNIPEDYTDRAFICADGAKGIRICGKGTINGNSDSEYYKEQFASGRFRNNDDLRPFGIFMRDCKDVEIGGVTLINAGFWGLRMFRCDGVDIHDVTIKSLWCVNNDGIDVDARNVHIHNCNICSDDDGICLKSNDRDFDVENILVEDCIIASNCNPIKFGTASLSTFKNVQFKNCKIISTGETHVWDWSKKYQGIEPNEPLGLSGITVQSADGAHIENLRFEDIDIDGIMTPFFLYIGERSGEPGSMKDIVFRNIKVNARGIIPSIINGHRNSKIENITFENISITADGYDGVIPESIRENETGYPENRMFGQTNPAGSFYIRHANGIQFTNVEVKHRTNDIREPVVLVDAKEITQL